MKLYEVLVNHIERIQPTRARNREALLADMAAQVVAEHYLIEQVDAVLAESRIEREAKVLREMAS